VAVRDDPRLSGYLQGALRTMSPAASDLRERAARARLKGGGKASGGACSGDLLSKLPRGSRDVARTGRLTKRLPSRKVASGPEVPAPA
jgi:hypothetical protein